MTAVIVLFKMEIWNGNKDLESVFRHEAFRIGRSRVTWRSTGNMTLSPSVRQTWGLVVIQHYGRAGNVFETETLGSSVVKKSHEDAISTWGFLSPSSGLSR